MLDLEWNGQQLFSEGIFSLSGSMTIINRHLLSFWKNAKKDHSVDTSSFLPGESRESLSEAFVCTEISCKIQNITS